MQVVIDALKRHVPGALQELRANEVAVPPWWTGRAIDAPRRAVQVGGGPIDVNSMDTPFDFPEGIPSVVAPGVRVLAGAWRGPVDSPPPQTFLADWAVSGVESFAWYSSFHRCSYAWGIFIRSTGVEVLAAEIVRSSRCDVDTAFRAAWAFLYQHELTHFKTDLVVAGCELASRTALYLEAKKRAHAAGVRFLTEEGLATAAGRRAMHREVRPSLDGWLSKAPAGYRDWRAHRSVRAADSWQKVIAETTNAPLQTFWTPTGNPPHESDVPVFLVLDSSVSSAAFNAAFIGPLVLHSETAHFRKDMNRLAKGCPRVRRLWEDRKKMLEEGALSNGGTQLEKIRNDRPLYSVRLNRELRAGLERTDHGWVAVAADHHDALYERLSRMR